MVEMDGLSSTRLCDRYDGMVLVDTRAALAIVGERRSRREGIRIVSPDTDDLATIRLDASHYCLQIFPVVLWTITRGR